MHPKARLKNDLKTALKTRDTDRVSAIRMAIAAIQQHEIDSGTREDLPHAKVIGILERLIKQRLEAATQFRKAGREERARKEEAEARLLESYLPEPIDAEHLEAEIRSVIHETGATSSADMGRIMGLLKARLAGRARMSEVSRRVREILSP